MDVSAISTIAGHVTSIKINFNNGGILYREQNDDFAMSTGHAGVWIIKIFYFSAETIRLWLGTLSLTCRPGKSSQVWKRLRNHYVVTDKCPEAIINLYTSNKNVFELTNLNNSMEHDIFSPIFFYEFWKWSDELLDNVARYFQNIIAIDESDER